MLLNNNQFGSTPMMDVSNGKALDLLFGPNNNHQKKGSFTNVTSHQFENFRSPPPPPYHFHTHASSSSQQGSHQLGWKGGSGQAGGHMMKAPRSNNGESATTTDVLTGLYKTSDASLYNHQYHDNHYVATNYTSNAIVMGTPFVDQQQQLGTSHAFINHPGLAASPYDVVYHSNNQLGEHHFPSLMKNNHFASSVFKQDHHQEQYNPNKQPAIDRVAPIYCHDSVVVARSTQNSSVMSNAYALPPPQTTMNHHYQFGTFTDIQKPIPDICYHDENTNLDNCKCHLRIVRPTHMLSNVEEDFSHSLEPHSKKIKLSSDSILETHSSSSSNASNSHTESTASRKNSLDGAKQQITPQTLTSNEIVATSARKPIVSKKSNTKKPKSDDNSQTKKKASVTKKASAPKSPVRFNVDLSKENLQDTSTIPIRILAYNLGLTKDIQKSWRYRDIRRALFERMIDEHIEFVDNQLEHSLLRERLPHKLTYSNFCKRVMLLVFHFVVRDGKEPKFFRRPLVQREYIEKLLKDSDPHFYSLVETSHAHQLHNLMNSDGKTFQEAITIVFKDLIDPATLQSLNGSSTGECRKLRKPSHLLRSQKKSCSDDEDEDDISDDEDMEVKPSRPRRRSGTELKRKIKSVNEDSDDDY